jgi:hypothetical protein
VGSASLQDSIGKSASKAKLNWYMEKANAFAHVSVSQTTFTVNFVDKSSSVVYASQLTKSVTGSPIQAPTAASNPNPGRPPERITHSTSVVTTLSSLAVFAVIGTLVFGRIKSRSPNKTRKAYQTKQNSSSINQIHLGKFVYHGGQNSPLEKNLNGQPWKAAILPVVQPKKVLTMSHHPTLQTFQTLKTTISNLGPQNKFRSHESDPLYKRGDVSNIVHSPWEPKFYTTSVPKRSTNFVSSYWNKYASSIFWKESKRSAANRESSLELTHTDEELGDTRPKRNPFY